MKRLVWLSMDYPRTTLVVTLLLTLVFAAQFVKIQVDADPENMLAVDQPDRAFYNKIKRDLGIHDLIVFGITDEAGIFRPETLKQVTRIIDGILKIPGVVTDDVVSLTTTNDVRARSELLEVRRIMQQIPEDEAGARALRTAIGDNPLLTDKLASRDGTGLAIYIPIARKDQAHRIGSEIEALAKAEFTLGQRYYLAGLPIAEDRFSAEMFQQMGIVAPLSGMVIFMLLWFLFRKLTLVVPVMAVAMFSVIWGMGLMIGTGFTVHVMTSMVPVFLMPIAVLDSVHILSEFYDRYPSLGDRRATLRATFEELFTPMVYTTLTSSVGFASLLFAPFPPVQVFGAFVAIGILIAWLLTMTLVPAAIMLLREDKLRSSLGHLKTADSAITNALLRFGRFVFRRAGSFAAIAGLLLVVGIWGMTRIVVNDNPVNWFSEDHEVRIADKAMNNLFGGTYMAYLVLQGTNEGDMKRPEVVSYMADLQRTLERDPVVGKTSSLADIVGQVSYVLHDTRPDYRKVPAGTDELAQYLFLYQMSGNVGDLDNFVDYDYRTANIWVQMKEGENLVMERVQQSVADYTAMNAPPQGITLQWSGLTHINKVWQDLTVVGMIKALGGSFVVVLILMVILFRSLTLGLLSMLPLTFAIILSYGLAGFIGKEYDMPIAVCSALALGLSIDFAIHFIQRCRACLVSVNGDLSKANELLFGETARAIVRNWLVLAIGFLPMTMSTLVPYKTVGVFFALLMTFSALTTLVLFPGLLKLTYGRLWHTTAVLQPQPAR